MSKAIFMIDSTIDWKAITRQLPLPEIPELLRQSSRLQTATAGTTLYSRGERPSTVICVLEGELRLVRYSLDGSEITLQRSRSGFIAEASMEADAYHCDVVTMEKSQLLLFPLPEFHTALNHDPIFNRAWIKSQANEVRRLRAQCERLSLNSASERILHYIEAEGVNGVLILTQSRKAWANELGLSHEVVYRTLKALHETKRITTDGNRITLLSPIP
ncbi:MAG: Crp/Fnr family transcriptional regulator [Gammaproteobacteria bacterium]|jgi:CRP-like cAMP-binding protein|nr:Crp/Fnr family transcriptional regulator [Gammaproteobacteria bacterium]